MFVKTVQQTVDGCIARLTLAFFVVEKLDEVTGRPWSQSLDLLYCQGGRNHLFDIPVPRHRSIFARLIGMRKDPGSWLGPRALSLAE